MGFGKLKKYKWWIAGGAGVAACAYFMKPAPEPTGRNWGKIALIATGTAIAIPLLGPIPVLVAGAAAVVGALRSQS